MGKGMNSGINEYINQLEEAHPLTHDLDTERCGLCGQEACQCEAQLKSELNQGGNGHFVGLDFPADDDPSVEQLKAWLAYCLAQCDNQLPATKTTEKMSQYSVAAVKAMADLRAHGCRVITLPESVR